MFIPSTVMKNHDGCRFASHESDLLRDLGYVVEVSHVFLSGNELKANRSVVVYKRKYWLLVLLAFNIFYKSLLEEIG